jgi:hypothetical protein
MDPFIITYIGSGYAEFVTLLKAVAHQTVATGEITLKGARKFKCVLVARRPFSAASRL